MVLRKAKPGGIVPMPLNPGKSRAAFEHNVKTEMNAGKGQKQALAIAYSEKRKETKSQSFKPPQHKDPLKRAFGNVGIK
jgi:hypothetical protein